MAAVPFMFKHTFPYHPHAGAMSSNTNAFNQCSVLLVAGMNKISDQQMAQAEKQTKLWTSMINSMTPHERETPEVHVFRFTASDAQSTQHLPFGVLASLGCLLHAGGPCALGEVMEMTTH